MECSFWEICQNLNAWIVRWGISISKITWWYLWRNLGVRVNFSPNSKHGIMGMKEHWTEGKTSSIFIASIWLRVYEPSTASIKLPQTLSILSFGVFDFRQNIKPTVILTEPKQRIHLGGKVPSSFTSWPPRVNWPPLLYLSSWHLSLAKLVYVYTLICQSDSLHLCTRQMSRIVF